jgi:hypothetical protein
MAWWVYKCNSKKRDYQVDYGDWEWFFNRRRIGGWGTTENIPSLAKLRSGDMIIAYQTDRNELVGICRMARFKKAGLYKTVHLEPLERIGIKVRPLKEADPRVAAIPAFQGGPIMTLYSISEDDVRLLLKAADASTKVESEADNSEESFLEGEKRAVVATARNPKLRAAAKKHWGLKCCCCGFDFEQFYGSVAKGLAIVHHLELFPNANDTRREATVEDVRVVCANCHYVIHVQNPPIEVDDLKLLISKEWTPWSEKGVSRRGKDV